MLKAGVVFFIIVLSSAGWAQAFLIPQPFRDPQIPLLKAAKVKTMRTLEVKDSLGWKPTRCDYWDTSYFTYSKTGVRKMFVAYDPIEVGDHINQHQCTSEPRPVFTIKGKNGMPDQTVWDSSEIASDTIISLYDNDGYLLTKVSHSRSTGNKRHFWHIDTEKRLVGSSVYDYLGLSDSDYYRYNDNGKLLEHRMMNRYAKYNDVKTKELVYDFQHNAKFWIYDSLGRATYEMFEREGKADTSMTWEYYPYEMGLKYYYRSYRNPNKDTVIHIDMAIYDGAGRIIGHIDSNNYRHSTTKTTFIHGKRTEYKSWNRRGYLETDLSSSFTKDGSPLREDGWREGGIISKMEYTYDTHGLQTGVKVYRNKYQDKKVKLIRELQYLYTY